MNRIVVLARRGAAPSRLAPALPESLARELRAALLADALAAAAGCGADERTLAWAAGDEPGAPPAGFGSLALAAPDAGGRLESAFAHALRAPGDRAVVAGADLPGLAPAHLGAALAALASHDVALAPASDGGCALIGLAAPAPGLLRELPWDAGEVAARAREYAAALGLRVAALPALAAIATPADLARLVAGCAAAAPGPGPCGARTRATLRAQGLLP